MRVGELFAGIGGFGLGAQRAGHSVAWAVEIDPFARAVYDERFHGHILGRDVREFPSGPDENYAVDCITAGFPCQDLSVAGKRKGLVGERSGLFWEIIRIAGRLRPRWLLLENVPGLRSSPPGRQRGRDLAIVLAALGYGVAWTSLDAQFFGLAQQRERVFLVGHLGGPCPAEVLFEPEGVSGDTPPRREAGTRATQSLTRSLGSGGADDNDAQGGLIVIEDAGRKMSGDARVGLGIREGGPCYTHQAGSRHAVARTLTGTMHKGHDDDTDTIIAHTLTGEGADASEDGTGRGTPIVAQAFGWNKSASQTMRVGETTDALQASPTSNPAVMFSDPRRHDIRGVHRGDIREKPCLNATNNDLLLAPTLRVGGREQGAGNSGDNTPIVADVRPRRLTPRECERLQGFPDDWTLIDGASDSARYRALGNAVAVPVVEWILRRMGGSAQGDR